MMNSNNDEPKLSTKGMTTNRINRPTTTTDTTTQEENDEAGNHHNMVDPILPWMVQQHHDTITTNHNSSNHHQPPIHQTTDHVMAMDMTVASTTTTNVVRQHPRDSSDRPSNNNTWTTEQQQQQQNKREALYNYYNNGNSFVGITSTTNESQQPSESSRTRSRSETTSITDAVTHRFHDDDDEHDTTLTYNTTASAAVVQDTSKIDQDQEEEENGRWKEEDHDESENDDDDDDDIVAQLLRQPHRIITTTTRSTTVAPLAVVGEEEDVPVTHVPGRYANTPFETSSSSPNNHPSSVSISSIPPPLTLIEFDPTITTTAMILPQHNPIDEDEVNIDDQIRRSVSPPLTTTFMIDRTTPISQSHWISTTATAVTTATATTTNDVHNHIRNCYGVVHVRVLRAQRLSCPIHSNVSIIYKLYPWKGKVRSSSSKYDPKTFVVPPSTISVVDTNGVTQDTTPTTTTLTMDHGVCAQWVDPNETHHRWEDDHYYHRNNNSLTDGMSSRHSVGTTTTTTTIHNNTNTTNSFVKMIHAYSDPLSSPIPTIQIDLVFNPIPFIEFTMCTFHIDCTRLFQYPNRIHTQWFTAITSNHNYNSRNSNNNTTTMDDSPTNWFDIVNSHIPLIEIEAMFEPAVTEVSSNDEVIHPPLDHHVESNSHVMMMDHDERVLDSMNAVTVLEKDDSERSDKVLSGLTNMAHSSDTMMPVFERDLVHRHSHHELGDNDDDDDDDEMSVTTTRTSKTAFTTTTTSVVVPLQQHLLQISSFRLTPAFCCVCGKNIFSLQYPSLPFLSWNRTAVTSNTSSSSSWRCERCSVDCCDDCRLQVDISLPCGSDIAVRAVSNAIQNKFTIDKILNAVAPPTEVTRNNDASSNTDSPRLMDDNSDRTIPDNIDISIESKDTAMQGIGILKVSLQRAHILKDPLPAETDPMAIIEQVHPHLRSGDYYIRIHWSGGGNQIVVIGGHEQNLNSVRTRTIQRSSGQLNFSFDNEVMHFVVPHYGMEYRIDVIDAATDKAIGTGLITAQGLLQQQRDYLVEEKRIPFLSFLLKPILFTEMRRIVIELRAALKNGYSNDFYTPVKSRSSLSDGEVHTGDIVGCMELTVCLEENLEGLFGQKPYVCPPRPGDDLNMSVFQLHLQRLSNILDDFKQIVETYKFVVGWKNPAVTGVSLVVFLRLCIWFDPAYTGSVPVFISILLMIYLASNRAYGSMKAKYTQKEIEKYRKAENGVVNYDVHRPVGLVRLTIVKGRNIRSPELGLAGNVGCRVSLDLIRYMQEKQRKKAVEVDHSMSAQHEFGSTSFAFGTEPVWDRMIKSDRAMRMNLLLPHMGTFFDSDDETNDVVFPVLQPISTTLDLQVLDPWESSTAGIVVEVRLSDLLNVIPGSEYALGEVVIPLRDLVVKGEMSGWFNVVVTSPNAVTPNRDSESITTSESTKTDDPQLFLTINWKPPPKHSSSNFLEVEREASYAIQEEMIRSAVLARSQKDKVNILVSSIGALNNVRGISANLQNVQNQLGWALDFCESCIHLFDFTDPFKSSLILLALCALWLILSLISTRMIILTLGLVQYSLTLKARIDRWLRSGRSSKKAKTLDVLPIQVQNESPFATWAVNAIRGLPTSEDLRKIYFWESRRKGAQESESLSVAKRKARMKRLWRVQWYGTTRMLLVNKKLDTSEWRTVFVLVQGHRLLWWRSIHDFDNGIAPLGRLLLAGHAGLSNPSPLELREMNAEEMERVVCIFGSGSRATLLTSTVEAKLDLEGIIEAALFNKQD